MAGRSRRRPDDAVAPPALSTAMRTMTVNIQPGIRFQQRPAFGGRPRELVAADYVYSIKRFHDPRLKSGRLYLVGKHATAPTRERRAGIPFAP